MVDGVLDCVCDYLHVHIHLRFRHAHHETKDLGSRDRVVFTFAYPSFVHFFKKKKTKKCISNPKYEMDSLLTPISMWLDLLLLA